MKRFLQWIGVKQELDEQEHQPPYVTEGDFWWCSLGENVGVETYGKSDRFTRPVIILKKFGRHGFLAIPTTTKDRSGSWYVPFTHKSVKECAMLNQARFISHKRLDKKIGKLAPGEYRRIREGYKRLFM